LWFKKGPGISNGLGVLGKLRGKPPPPPHP